MALFKTKQTFHFEFEEIDNVNTTLIESFEELCDWVESENKRLANSEGKGSVLVLKKGDRDEKSIFIFLLKMIQKKYCFH